MTRSGYAVSFAVVPLFFLAGAVQAVEMFDTEAAFLAHAGDVSTVDFSAAAVPAEVFDPYVVIDAVRYEISSGRSAKCAQGSGRPCWFTSTDGGQGKLLSSAFFAVAMEEWSFGAGDWDIIRFGDRRSVHAIGFYIHSLLPSKPPGFEGWEMLVHERNGTTTLVSVPPVIKGHAVYRGFYSESGIWMIDIGSRPGPAAFNWAYEAVSHSPVNEHESDAALFPTNVRPLGPSEPVAARQLDNDKIERRGGLYFETKAKEPATGTIELRHPDGRLSVRARIVGGRKNGRETHWHANGQPSYEVVYVEGRKHGAMQQWHENGRKQSELTYYQGRIEGPAYWWYANGQQEIEVNYHLGRREGVERRWFENGMLESEVMYIANAPEGTSIARYPTGEKKSEGTFVDGRRHGKVLQWFANGQIRSEMHFADGKLEGRGTEWYENGQKSMTQDFEHGLRVGRQTQWYEDGQLKAELEFLNGKLHGRTTWYFPDGSREMEFHFRDGQLHGLGRQWHANGQLASEGEFKNGKVVGRHKFWDEKGRKLRSRPKNYPNLPQTAR